jgi:hypothetical protein
MSPPAVQQVISAIEVILGEDGSDRGIPEFVDFLFLLTLFLI